MLSGNFKSGLPKCVLQIVFLSLTSVSALLICPYARHNESEANTESDQGNSYKVSTFQGLYTSNCVDTYTVAGSQVTQAHFTNGTRLPSRSWAFSLVALAHVSAAGDQLHEIVQVELCADFRKDVDSTNRTHLGISRLGPSLPCCTGAKSFKA